MSIPLSHIGAGQHSPLFRRRHCVSVTPVEVPVPGNGTDSEDGGAGGKSVVLPGRASSLGRGGGRGRALYHPFRQPTCQLKRRGPNAFAQGRDEVARAGRRRRRLAGLVGGSYRSRLGGSIAGCSAGRARGTQCGSSQHGVLKVARSLRGGGRGDGV